MDYRLFLCGILFLAIQVKCQQQNFPQPTNNQNFQPQPGMNPNQPTNNQNFQPQPGMNQNQPTNNQNFQPQPGMNPNQPTNNQNFQPQPGMNPQNQPSSNQNVPQQPGMNQNNQNQQQGAQPNTNQGRPGNQGRPALTNEQQSQLACAQAGRTAVSQCFQSNGGYQMITVIGLLSNGTQGQLPANSDTVKQSLCQAQKQIVACIFDNIRKFNGSEQCNNLGAFMRLQQETIGLLNGVQQMCGTGIMPKVTPCMQRLTFDLAQCFNKVGLNADLYSARGSGMEGAIIGGNRESARMFCDKRQELFACQNAVLEKCPRAKDLQALSGNEQASMQKGMDVLCKDTDVYVSGLVCFQSPTQEVASCANDLVRSMTKVTIKQIRENLNADGFFTEYCRVRINNLGCDNNAWAKTCKPVAVGLKTEFQCNLLPTKCKTNPQVRDIYQQKCGVPNFARELRSTGTSGSGSLVSGVTSLVAVVLSSIVLLL